MFQKKSDILFQIKNHLVILLSFLILFGEPIHIMSQSNLFIGTTAVELQGKARHALPDEIKTFKSSMPVKTKLKTFSMIGGQDESLQSASDLNKLSAISGAQSDNLLKKFYTLDAEFKEGTSFNLTAKIPNQLMIDDIVKPFGFIWVAVSSKGTVVKIDTENGKVLGEYYTSPSGQPKDPSRTTVDKYGSVWVTNRAGNSVTRICLPESNLWIDKNGNGVCDTSTGLNNIKPWPNTLGADTNGGVTTAQDECIINYIRVSSSGTRHVSVDKNNNVWVSGTGNRKFNLIDGETGVIIRTEGSVGYGGYGGLIDKNDVIWSSNPLLRWDTSKPLSGPNGTNWKGYGHDSYGLGIDSQGNVWNTSLGGNRIHKFAPNGTLIGSYSHGSYYAQGCVAAPDGDIWVAHSLYDSSVGHIKNNGTYVGNVNVGNGPTGVAVDANGKIWATNYSSRTVSRIDPKKGPIGADGVTLVGAVDLTTVNLGGALYNYSDMTGSTLIGAPKMGIWTVVYDSTIESQTWGVISWNKEPEGAEPEGTLITARVASSNDKQNWSTWEQTINSKELKATSAGRYLKVEVTLRKLSSEISPILSDLTIQPSLNHNPQVDLNGPRELLEGGNASFTGTVTDSDGDAFTSEWDFGDGEKLTGGLTSTHLYKDNGKYEVVLKVNDEKGALGKDSLSVLVHNIAPVVEAGIDQTVDLAEEVQLSGAEFSDPGVLDTHIAYLNWGDGVTDTVNVAEVNGSGTITASHRYQTGGKFPVLVSVVDKDGGIGKDICYVTVKVTHPVIEAGPDREINEGDSVQFAGQILPPAAGYTVKWNFGDGSEMSADLNPAHKYLDNGLYTVTLAVSDNKGWSAVDTLQVKVNNLPPIVEAGPDQSVKECEAVRLPPALFTDAGVLDTHSALIDWGDGKNENGIVVENQGAGKVYGSHRYEKNGDFAVKVTVTDKDGAFHQDTLQVNVQEVANIYELYPIALHQSTIANAVPGQSLGDIFNGSNPGNFGWLSWNGRPDANTIAASLHIPGNSSVYINPRNANDHELSIGDWVNGAPGVNNAKAVRDALDKLINYTIAVPVWDSVTGQGKNVEYHIIGFAVIRITNYVLPAQNRISAVYLGMVNGDIPDWKAEVYNGSFAIGTSGNLTKDLSFTLPNPTGNYMLIFKNGKEGSGQVSGALVTLNGQVIVAAGEVNTSVKVLKKLVVLQTVNILHLELSGTADAFAVIVIKEACGNNVPRITSQPQMQANPGVTYLYDVEAIDPDNDPLTYSLLSAPVGMVINSQSGLINWSPGIAETGNYVVLIEVADNRGGVTLQHYLLSMSVVPNQAPIITSLPIETAREGDLYTYDVEATDADNDPLTFRLEKAPQGMSIDAASGLISWIPSAVQSGLQAVNVVAVDSRQARSQVQTYSIQVEEVLNSDPVIVSTPVTQAWEGKPYLYQLIAVDADRDILEYSLKQAVNGMELDKDSGLIVWVPEADQAGTYDVVAQVIDNRGGLAVQAFTVEISENVNSAPLITSTAPLTGVEGVEYLYQVLASDADGDKLTYSLLQSPQTMEINGSSGEIRWTPNGSQAGSHAVVVEVTDNHGGLDRESFALVVQEALNGNPLITSVPVTDGMEGQLYYYYVEATDPDNDWLVFTLPVAPQGMSIHPLSGMITWIPSELQSGKHQITVEAGDGREGIAQQSYEIIVGEALNTVPEIVSQPVLNGKEGELYSYEVKASDADNDKLTYNLKMAPADMSIDSNSGVINWIPSGTQGGKNGVVVEVNDGRGGSDRQSFIIDVSDIINNDPEIFSQPIISGEEGKSYIYQVEAFDLDQDPLTFTLTTFPRGMMIDNSTGKVEWIPDSTQSGERTVTLQVSDGRSGVDTQTFVIEVLEALNTNPLVTSEANTSGKEIQPYKYEVKASDADNDPLSYSLTNAPSGMTIDSHTGVISWLPNNSQAGEYAISLRVADNRGGEGTQNYTLIIADFLNIEPQITSQPIVTGKEGERYGYLVTAVDGNSDELAFSLPDAPPGMTIDSDSGQIFWTPSGQQSGDYVIKVKVNDPWGGFAEQSYTLKIEEFINTEPQITSQPVTMAVKDVAYAYDLEATDADHDILTYRLITAPAGMEIEASTGLISWTPNIGQIGSQQVKVEVADGRDGIANQDFQIFVNQSENHAPIITSLPEGSTSVGMLYQYQVLANDEDKDLLAYSLKKFPEGMVIDGNTGLVSWTPTENQLNSNEVSIEVTDGRGGYAVQNTFIQVHPWQNHTPVITSLPIQSAGEGKLYGYQVLATDEDNDSLTYTLIQSPIGMVIDSNSGMIVWTPETAQIGPNLIKVEVADGHGGLAFQEFTVQVQKSGQVTDAVNPQVDVVVQPLTALVGGTVVITVNASDNVGVVSRGLLVNGGVVALNASNKAYYKSIQVGIFVAEGYALDAAGNEGRDSAEFKFLTNNQGVAPEVSISAPADFGKLLTPTDIIGSVTDADNDLLRYTLSYSPKDKNIFTVFVEGTTPVTDGILGKLDTTALDNGLYDIRLRAEDATGRIDYFDMVVEVSGRMKLGNFSLSFKDLEIPMAGIPISIIRTYDSRKRVEHGDFGFGWQLSFANEMKLEVSCSLAGNWYEYYEPGGMNRLPKFWIEETKEHFVTITYPDGRVDKFRMKMTPMSDITKIRFLNYSFTPEPGTFSSLRALGCPARLYTMEELGPFTLVDEDSYDEFAPQRYELSTAEGYKYVINKNSGVESITDNNGNKITISADGIIHSGGKSVTFVRGSANRITVIKDPDGNEIKYDYDYYGDMISVTDALGNKVRFIYNSEHYLTDIIDPRGFKVARNEYDDSGRLIANIDAEGNRIVYTHDIAGREEIVTDRLGNQTRFIYDERGNVLAKTDALGNTWNYTYDANDNKLSEEDPLNNTSNYTYDSKNNLLTQTDPLGHTTTYTYNTKNQALTITDAQGNVTSNEYDAKGNLSKSRDALNHETVYTYDAAGNLKTAIDPAGNLVTNNYDAAGNLTSITNPLNHITTFTYDSRGNQLTQTINRTLPGGGTEAVTSTNVYSKTNQVIQTIDPNGFATVTGYNSLGKQSATIDKLGRRTEYEYDIRGNLIKTKFPDNTESIAQYDPEGRRIASKERDGSSTAYAYNKTGQLIKTTYADGYSTQTMYDNAGRVYQNIDERGNATTYDYDAAGRKTAVIDALGHSTAFAYDENNNLIMMTDAKNQMFRYEYDALNRKTRTIFPDNSFTSIAYDNLGRKASETDQAGKTTAYNYDALGRLIKVTNALNQDTRYNYDELGSLITQTDAQNRITNFAYDKLGRRTRRTLPLGMFETMQYNALGNITGRTDFNGNTITFEYNLNNQLARKNLPDGQAEVYVYNNAGQMQSVSDSRGTITYQYDSRGRMLRRIDPDGAQIAYGYDEAGNRTSVTIPSATIAYTYDDLNRLQSVSAPYGSAAYSYDNVGNRESVSYANGTVSEYSYNSLNRLVFLKNRKNSGEVISSYQYTLGPAGNRTRVIEHNGRIVDYAYDNTYKLLEESISDPLTGNRVIGYTYDAVGNRQAKTDNGQVTQYAYDANDRLLTENAAIYSYDNNGNTLRKQSPLENLTYSYDYQNRMTASVLINNAGVTNLAYKYDPFGIRVEKTTNNQTIKYLVDHNLPYAQVLEERNAMGNLQASYVYGDDLISQNRLTGTSYYHYDGLGSTRTLTDPSANITDSYTYEAFGTILNKTGTTANDYLFTGEQYDPNLGFYYLRARYYDPNIGRFTTLDTWEGVKFDPSSLHKYLYCANDPVNRIDPSGKMDGIMQMAVVSAIIGTIFSGAMTALRGGNISEIVVGALFGGMLGFGGAYIIGSLAALGATSVIAGLTGTELSALLTSAGLGFSLCDLTGKVFDKSLSTKERIIYAISELILIGLLVKAYTSGMSTNVNPKASPNSPKFNKHVPQGKAEARGWSLDDLNSVTKNPNQSIKTIDARFDPVARARGNFPATAYLDGEGNYVILRDFDGDIVQVSDKYDLKWLMPWNKW